MGLKLLLSLGKGRGPHVQHFFLKLTLRNCSNFESRLKGEDRGVSLVLVSFGPSQLQGKCDYAMLFAFQTEIKA